MTTVLTIFLLPLVAFVIQIFVGKRLPRQGDWISTGAIGIALALSVGLLVQILKRYDPTWHIEHIWSWLQFGDRTIALGIYIDNLAVIMLVVVTLVSFLVHVFSIGYMHDDTRYSRFFAYLSLFSFSMLGIIVADNLLSIYVFWELVGLSSYLLIGFWFEKNSAANACKKAFITNRVGDVGMLVGILLVFMNFNTFELKALQDLIGNHEINTALLTIAGLCLFCGAIGKSAQFPLHVWLPDAMEGPTPVSALIHAATMVAAGVYLVTRIFFMLTADALLGIAYIGAITLFLGSTIALVQNDIKKVLAYSTISQLGYMIMGLGVGSYVASFFHLVTHAAFKACLFLGSGSVIHAMHHAMDHLHVHDDAQDMRYMGALKRRMPITYKTFLIATLALCGVPFTSGFLSKDAILAGSLSFAVDHPIHSLLPLLGFMSAGMTVFYMFRLVFMTFTGDFHYGREELNHIHESPKVMTGPLLVLAFLSLYFIYTIPSFNFLNADQGWFFHLIQMPHAIGVEHGHHSHVIHYVAMGISILMIVVGLSLAYGMYFAKKISPQKLAEKFPRLYQFLLNKWYFDELYNNTIVAFIWQVAQVKAAFDHVVIDGVVNGIASWTCTISRIHGWWDNYVVDGIVNGVAKLVDIFGFIIRLFQTGRIQTYIYLTMIALITFFAVWLRMS